MNPIEIEPELDEDEAIDQLNEIYGDVDVCGIKYDAGYLLKEIDPVAFYQSKLDLEDGMEHKWECGNCGEQYDTEDEAEDCCKLPCEGCATLFDPDQLQDGYCEVCIKDGLDKEEDNADS